MKIAFFFESISPEGNAVALRADTILKTFNERPSIKIIGVLTATGVPTPIDGIKFLQVGVSRQEKKRSIVHRILRELLIGFRASKKVYTLRKSIDVLYISSPPYITSVILVLTCKLLKIKYIFEVRDVYPEAYLHAGLLNAQSISIKILKGLSRFIYNQSILTISATQGINEIIGASAPNSKRLHVSNGFPEALISIPASKFEKFTIAFHGVLGEFQDIELLCDIARRIASFDDIELIVIGGGSKAEDLKEVFNAHKNLKFFDRMSFNNTIDIISRCHIGLSLRTLDPISIRSFPVKNWEYLGLGIPSITTPIASEASKFLLKHKCGININQGSSEEIIKSILRYKDNKSDYSALVENCISVRSNHTREALSNKAVNQILDNILPKTSFKS